MLGSGLGAWTFHAPLDWLNRCLGHSEVHMPRDHRKLRVFHDGHQLVLSIYRQTMAFPKDEWFGIRQQMRRAATSVPTNIVEGSARRTTGEYLNFLNVARGSIGELHYLIDLASELGFLGSEAFKDLNEKAERVSRQLTVLLQQVEVLVDEEREQPKSRSLDAKRKARKSQPQALSPEP